MLKHKYIVTLTLEADNAILANLEGAVQCSAAEPLWNVVVHYPYRILGNEPFVVTYVKTEKVAE